MCVTTLAPLSNIVCLQVYIKHAQKFLYVAEIDGKVLMKIGKAKYEPDSSTWKPLKSGKNWAIWMHN